MHACIMPAYLQARFGRRWVQIGVPNRALHQLPHYSDLLAFVLRVAGPQVLDCLIDVGHIIASPPPGGQQQDDLLVRDVRPATAASLTLAFIAHCRNGAWQKKKKKKGNATGGVSSKGPEKP